MSRYTVDSAQLLKCSARQLITVHAGCSFCKEPAVPAKPTIHPGLNASVAHRSLGFEAGFGYHVHLSLLNQVVKLVTSISECRDLDLPTSRVYKVEAEHLALPSGVVIGPHSTLDRYSGLDCPAVLVGIQAVDGHNLGRCFIAGNGRTASPVIWCWLPICTSAPLWSPILITTPAGPVGTAC